LTAITEISCPKCGGNELTEKSKDRYVCNYCGSILLAQAESSELRITGWRCPSCSAENSPNSKFCGKCGFRITKHCPKCGKDIQHHLNFCTSCSFQFLPGETTVHECIAGLGGLLNAHRITLTNKRLCGLADNRFSSGFFEILLSDIEKVKVKGSSKMTFRNRKGRNKITLRFNVPSELPELLLKQLGR